MADSRSARKTHGVALADLGDVVGFENEGKEGQVYGFEFSNGRYKRKEITQKSVSLGELEDVSTEYAIPRLRHVLTYAGESWAVYPQFDYEEDTWLIDLHALLPFVQFREDTKKLIVKRVINRGMFHCSYVPVGENPIYMTFFSSLKTLDGERGVLKMDTRCPKSSYPHVGPKTTVILKLVLGEKANEWVEVLPGISIKWPAKHIGETLVATIITKGDEPLKFSQTIFNLDSIGIEFRGYDLRFNEIYIGPVLFRSLKLKNAVTAGTYF